MSYRLVDGPIIVRASAVRAWPQSIQVLPFSPTTRYRDYAISRELVHWESQSVTRADSKTGLRYQHHAAQASHVMLFARLRSDDRAFGFLGPARYVKHEGELPMAVTWRPERALPGDLFATFAAAVA